MDTLLYYKEAKEGQILEEGITEAGSISSFIAAGSAYATHGINTIPFFIYYSMFGMQRVGDLVWAAADTRTRGFLLGGTAGRTTLAGEGLQHQDGHSHLLSLAVPNLISYDPAFAYEIAVIIEDGIRRMYKDGESIFYYITVMNEQYEMPAMPEGARDGILKGMYQAARVARRRRPRRGRSCSAAAPSSTRCSRRSRSSRADYDVAADVWSVTSYQELYRDGHAWSAGTACIPASKPRVPYVTQCLGDDRGRDRRGVGLREGDGRRDRPLDAAPADVARHRRLRPQRGPCVAAGFLRGGCEVHRRRRRSASWRATARSSVGRAEGDQGSRDQSREAEPGDF